MKIKHVINDFQSMSLDGGKILQSLQNNYLPKIDIIVRESIQNSLDATKKHEKETIVDFKVDKFNSDELAPYFEEIDKRLLELYPGKQKYLSFSDKNTEGLSGDYASTDPEVLKKSNFHKLVFGIGQNQEAEGAGGSWGYGKTSYFRIGIGLVIYYTRVKEKSGYEERLIGSMIEDPKSKDRLLPKNDRGIAWWGELEKSNNINAENRRIFPITDSKKIKEILSIFGLENYVDEETGTTIIIPYLKQKSLDDVIDEEIQNFSWEKTYAEEIKVSVQKWYFPRLLNKEYKKYQKNSMLTVSVNNVPIVEFDMEPIFAIQQELYNAALIGKSTDKNIKVKELKFGRNALKDQRELVGRVAFKVVTKKDLKMLPPYNKENGLAYLGVKDKSTLENFNSRILAYCRKPGMIVEYDIDADWTPTNVNLDEDSILISIFVPNSNALLADGYKKSGYSNLESYLRDIESSDHANWIDNVNITLVKRMKTYSRKLIAEEFKEENNEYDLSVTSGLSRRLGAILLPPTNFGKSSTRRDNTVKRQVETRNRAADLTILNSNPIDESTVEVELKVFIRDKADYKISVHLISLDRNIDESDWNNHFNEKFPFEIKNVFIKSLNEVSYNNFYRDFNEQQDKLKFIKKDYMVSSINISSNTKDDITIEGVITVHIATKEFLPTLTIRNA